MTVMSQTRDYYEVLGVSRRASMDEIRQAYRKLAREFHPDVNKSEDAARRFAEVQQAYEVLSDDKKRAEYDRFGHGAFSGSGGHGWGGQGAGGVHWSSAHGGAGSGDFASVFEQFFRSGGQGASPFDPGASGFGSQAPPRPRRGRNLRHALQISFLTAAKGGAERLRLTRAGQAETIDVKIPPATEDGAKLRVRGQGEPGATGGSAGDLILTIEVGQHPDLRREGLHLYRDVTINLAEAALGTTVSVPLLDEGSVDVKIPAGTSSGRRLRIRGKGLTDVKGETGDFFVVVQIHAPQSLSDRARALLDQLAGELEDPNSS